MGLQKEFATNSDKLIQQTEGIPTATSIGWEKFQEKLFALEKIPKKRTFGDGYSEAKTIYAKGGDEDGGSIDMKSLKSKKSGRAKKRSRKKRQGGQYGIGQSEPMEELQ